jgi:glutamyl-tRNA synthetase
MNTRETAHKYAIKNAYLHKGKANLAAVIGKIKALNPNTDLKKEMPNILEEIKKINSMNFEEIKKEYTQLEDTYELKPPEKREGLNPLEWTEKEPTITRFAPNPNGPIHLGHLRAALTSFEYAKKYNGKFILRFDDTDPKVKKPIENAKEIFLKDLNWIGIYPDKIFFASDRLKTYHKYMQKTIEIKKAYICTCKNEEWKKLTLEKKTCPCREKKTEEQIILFKKMLENTLKEGQAVLRIKTDLKHPDVSVRDWWAAKIVDNPNHPRVKEKIHVWPSYNFASAIDDHELEITLIIRGQEHEQNMTKQKYLYNYFKWTYPHAIHYGRIKFGNMILSTSKILKGIQEGLYTGFDDPRLGTITALRKRGYQPHALKKALLELGTNPNDTTIEPSKVTNYNKKIIEPTAKRITFIEEPAHLDIKHCPEQTIEKFGQTHKLKKGTNRFLAEKKQLEKLKKEETFRLSNALNAKLENKKEHNFEATFDSFPHKKTTTINWVTNPHETTLIMDDNTKKTGLIDGIPLKENDIIHSAEIGFARVDDTNKQKTTLYFTHK